MRKRWAYTGKGFISSGSELVSPENPSCRQCDLPLLLVTRLVLLTTYRLRLTFSVRDLGPFLRALGCASILLLELH